MVAADAKAIRAAGFDHVRLPLDPEFIGWKPATGGAPPRLDLLDAALALLAGHDLAVILSFHPREETRDEIELRRPYQDAYVQFWTLLAQRYRAAPPDRLVFAVMNEPQYYVRGPARWNQLQQRVAQAIRAVDPNRVLALSGIGGASIDYLDRLAPIADANAFHVFHFYEPYLVTHFGANWEPFTKEPGALVARVVYPSTEMTMAIAAIGLGPQRADAEKLVRDYIDRPWTADTIDRRIALAAAWARRANTRLVCTEFGVLRARIDPGSRTRWIGDVRRALEHHGIGWSVWDYADLFGIATATGDVDYPGDGAVVPRDAKNPRRAFDAAAIAALGL
ncbi:MAG: cellulase family glycosylhydrolase [Alphaproteobacteria bacterium]|nr:cellulase family glycosylhydrolase [Alphaproteobacteria bacterium]